MKTAVVLRPLFIFDDGILRGAWLQVVISHRRSPTLFVDFFFFFSSGKDHCIPTSQLLTSRRNSWPILDTYCCSLESQPRCNFVPSIHQHTSANANDSNWDRRNLSRDSTLDGGNYWPNLIDCHTLLSDSVTNRRNRSEWLKLRRHEYFLDLSNDRVPHPNRAPTGQPPPSCAPPIYERCLRHLFQRRSP